MSQSVTLRTSVSGGGDGSSRERGGRPDDSDPGVNQAPPAEVGTESTRSR